MHEKRRTRPDPRRIDISHHALLRVYQRLGIIEGARERVRELLAKATPVDDPQYPNCRAYRYGDVTIVVDRGGDVVQTVVTEAEPR